MNPLEIREIAVAFQKSRIVLTAYELDIFTFIDKKSHNSETISKDLNLDKDALEFCKDTKQEILNLLDESYERMLEYRKLHGNPPW